MIKKMIVSGTILAGSAVILGALNAHYLKQFFTPELTESFDTGIKYQMYHSLAMLILPALNKYIPLKRQKLVFGLFLSGVILFSGSIYLLCGFKSNGIIGLSGLGILTPIGGVFLMLGWLQFLLCGLKAEK